jgi:hypothetical protein
MEIARERRAAPKRIGELLVAANAIKPEILTEALQIAKKSSTPLGRVLMSIGELTERDLESALEVQALLRDSVISADFGVRALNIAVKGCLSIEESFKKLGWKPPSTEYAASGEFGDLLLEAGILSRAALESAMRQSQENRLPLGRCLVLSRSISSALLVSSLTAQILLRDGKIKRQQAIDALKSAATKHQSLENSLEEVGVFKSSANSIRVGDLLVASGLITDGDKISAIEVGLNEQKPIGQILIQSGKITNQQLQDCLRLQEKVSAGNLTAAQAAEILDQATARRLPIEVVVGERNVKLDEIARANEVIQILTVAGLISPEDYAKSESVSKATNISLGEVMLNNGTIERPLLRNAVQAFELIKKNMLKEDQAVAGLRYSHKTGLELVEALKEVFLLPSTKSNDLSVDSPSSWLNKLFTKKTS